MLDCLILGDSIAVGVGRHRPDCETRAYVGAPSIAYVGASPAARLVVISLGSNDAAGTYDNLAALRRRIRAARVVWIVPARNRGAVEAVARAFHDEIATIPELAADGIHPTARAYREIAKTLR